MARRLFLFAAAVASLSIPTAAHAYECTLDAKSCLVSPRWASRIVPYTIEDPPADSPISKEALQQAVRNSVARWAAPACTDLQVEEIPGSDNVVRVITHDWPKGTEQAAYTHLKFDGITGSISKATIFVNAVDHEFSEGTCVPGTLDLETVLTHEFGHYIGLAHPCSFGDEANEMEAEGDKLEACPTESCDALLATPGANPQQTTILWPVANDCQSSFHDLRQDDIEGVCSIYPRGTDPVACAELPQQADPYVANQAFGCTGVASGGDFVASAFLVVFFGLGLISRKR